MLIVISPAKKLDYAGAVNSPLTTQPALIDHSEELAQGLKALAPQDVSSLMSLSDKLGALNFERFQGRHRSLTKMRGLRFWPLKAMSIRGSMPTA